MLKFGRHVEKMMQFKWCYGQGSGGKAPGRWAIFAISGKKITTLTLLESHFERFKGHWIEQRR